MKLLQLVGGVADIVDLTPVLGEKRPEYRKVVSLVAPYPVPGDDGVDLRGKPIEVTNEQAEELLSSPRYAFRQVASPDQTPADVRALHVDLVKEGQPGIAPRQDLLDEVRKDGERAAKKALGE